jgi:hypothetical protein
MSSILKRISPEEITAAAYLIWKDPSTANKIAQSAIQTINQTHKRKFTFYNGKKSRTLVSGLFYLLGYRYDAAKKQRELAWKLGTSDVTVRASYREWLEEFPDLFLDVIGKFAQDNNLRYFVLLNLQRSAHDPENNKVY